MLFSERFEVFVDGLGRMCKHSRCRWLNILLMLLLWILGGLLILLGTADDILPPAGVYIGITVLNIGLIVAAYECCMRKRLPNTEEEEAEIGRLLQAKQE